MIAARTPDIAYIVLLAGPGLRGEETLYLQGAAITRVTGGGQAALTRQKDVQQILMEGAKLELDDQDARKRIYQKLDEYYATQSADDRQTYEKSKTSLDGEIKRVLSPWFRFFIAYDPSIALQKVRCPVLALNGEKDTQVVPKENLDRIEKALKAGGNKDFFDPCRSAQLEPSLSKLRNRGCWRNTATSKSRSRHQRWKRSATGFWRARVRKPARESLESLVLAALLGKEVAQNGRASLLEHAAHDLGPMIETGIAGDLKERIARSGFGVGSPVHDHRKARLDDGAGAHGARFERRESRAARAARNRATRPA